MFDNIGYTKTMRASDLTPTVITDVNGKITTVHKRAQSSQGTQRSAIPPIPSTISDLLPLKKTHSRVYKPNPYQKYQRSLNVISWHNRVDPKLSEMLNLYTPYSGSRHVQFSASEVECYSVFSATSYENAIILMESGIRSKEDALQFLEDNGLDHLAEDHNDLMDMALRRKLNFSDFLLFMQRNYKNDIAPKLFADAAEANNIKGLREKAAPPSRTIPVLVLNGELALEDLKTMTTTRIASSATGEATINALIAINKGERDYTAMHLRRALEATSGSLTDEETIELIDSIGITPTGFIRDKKRGYAIHWEVKDRDGYKYDKYKRVAVMHYGDIMSIYRRTDDAETVIELFESGTDASTAAKALNKGMTVPQIIAVHSQGAPKSISTGWL